MRSWKMRLALCFVLAVLGAAAVAPAAYAACESGNICLFTGPALEGSRLTINSNGRHNLAERGFNDLTSSAWNNTNRWAVLWQNAEGTGSDRCIRPESAISFAGEAFERQASNLVVHTNEEGKPPIC